MIADTMSGCGTCHSILGDTMAKGFMLVCLMLLAWSADATARCSVPLIHTFNNQAADGRMTVSSGSRCSIKLRRSSGPTYSASIVQRPSHGTVSVDGSNRIVYQSRAGYTGSDEFTYARHGES